MYGINELLDSEGLDSMEFLEVYAMDSVVPGICEHCGATYEYEPDQDKGYCEECESNSVKSGLILLGVI